MRAWQQGRLAPPWRVQLAAARRLGIFNLVEGLIDDQSLGIHQVRDERGGPIGWDLGCLPSASS